MRELAQRSANAAKEIKVLITSGSHVEQGGNLVRETGTVLEAIVSEVHEVNRHVCAIAEA